jgi:hypothetical protein
MDAPQNVGPSGHTLVTRPSVRSTVADLDSDLSDRDPIPPTGVRPSTQQVDNCTSVGERLRAALPRLPDGDGGRR